MTIELEVQRHADHLQVRWSTPRSGGSARFDHLRETVPEWLGSADDLLDGATRRDEGQVLDALAAWAHDAGVVLGVWHADGAVEILEQT